METTRTAVDQAGEVRGRTNSSTPRPPIAAAAASCQATVTSGRPQRTTDPASAITVGAAAPENASPARHASRDRKSTRLNSSHVAISYAVFCLKKKKDEKDRYCHCQ